MNVSQVTNDGNKFTTIFEMDNETQKAKVYRPSASDLSNPLSQIARYVAATGQILNIGDVTTWLKKDVVQAGSDPIKSILCMPIVNGQRNVIGVAQLINKVEIHFLRSQNSRFSTNYIQSNSLSFKITILYNNLKDRTGNHFNVQKFSKFSISHYKLGYYPERGTLIFQTTR